jgi:hypothetical protein
MNMVKDPNYHKELEQKDRWLLANRLLQGYEIKEDGKLKIYPRKSDAWIRAWLNEQTEEYREDMREKLNRVREKNKLK